MTDVISTARLKKFRFRNLREHTLLQAIARVNRLHEGKEYGLILDYSGVIQELDEAIDFYGQLADYDRSDLEATVTYISDKVSESPQIHSNLWELFGQVKGIKDPEVYEIHLHDAELRNQFYDRFSLFACTLSLALSSTGFLQRHSIFCDRKKEPRQTWVVCCGF
ncbi:conserved hypothetical protein [delta proteobacterium NaphS2]|nr:conserved hypothetical protein [delta proteobacterium NaphS2]